MDWTPQVQREPLGSSAPGTVSEAGTRTCILVLGMHRSGTSALTRVLSLLGAALPQNIMAPAAENNEAGFWEPDRLVAWNEHILRVLASSWDDWRRLDLMALEAASRAALVDQLVELIASEYGDAPLFVLKDPRICRFVPLYVEALSKLGIKPRFVLSIRNPLAVMRSLAARDGIVEPYSGLLWLRHALDAEWATRSASRAFVSYDTLLADWRTTVARLAEGPLSDLVSMPDASRAEEIDAFLREGLRHHAISQSELVERSDISDWVKDAFAALLQLDANSIDATALAVLDQVRGEFEAVAPAFAAIPVEFHRREAAIKAAASAELNRREADLQASIEALTRDLAAARDGLAAQEKTSTALQEQAAAEQRRAAEIETGLRHEAAMLAEKLSAATGAVQSLATALATSEEQTSRLLEAQRIYQRELEAVRDELAARNQQIAALDADLASRDQQLAKLSEERITFNAELADTEERAEQAERALASQAVELSAVRAALGRQSSELESLRSSLSWRMTAPWRRGLAMLRSVRSLRVSAIAFHPAHHLNLVGRAGNKAEWQMTGIDPQFAVDLTHAGPLPPGHYRLLVEFPEGLDALAMPCLYVDSGQGLSDHERVELRFDVHRRGQGIASFTLPRGARALRFDPSHQPGRIVLGDARLRRMARSEHYVRLTARVVRERVRSRADLARYATRAWELFLQGGLRALTAQLRTVDDRRIVNDGDYQRWIASYDTLSDQDGAAMRRASLSFAHRPLVSIIMPVYDTPERLLRQTIESVLAQTYANWELCIADDASSAPHVRRVLEQYRAADHRIKVVYRAENGHIARASNSALEIATGEWVALLDHDDLLAPHALFCVVDAINRRPDVQLIYSDEDKVDETGRRYDPYFKPDFLLDLFRAQNYINHLTVHRTDNIRRVGGFRAGFEGSQDYDLNLRIIETQDPRCVVHLPHVLYHWRAVAGSTALAQGEKSYAWQAGWRALNDHVARCSIVAEVTEVPSVPFYRMKFALPESRPLVSIIIPMRDRADLARMSLQSIFDRTSYQPYEIIIVDNGSVEADTKAWFAEVSARPNVRVLPFDVPFNFSAINNYAAGRASGEMLALVNNDIEVISPDWLGEMVSWAAQERVGCVGAKLYYPNGTLQHGGVILGVGGIAGHSHKHCPKEHFGYFSRLKVAQNISAVTAACLLVRREVYMKVGGLDAENLSVAFNDVDFCLRVRETGYVNVWTPFAEMVHHESISRGYEDSPEKIARFNREIDYMHRRWGDELRRDPAYSPNLTLDREDFSFAFPPRAPKPWR